MMHTHPYLWSKQDGLNQTYPLLAHMLDTVAVGQALYNHWLRPGLQELLTDELGEKSKSIFLWIAGSHDIGKASPIFQYQPRRKGPEWDQIRQDIKSQEQFSFASPFLQGKLQRTQVSFLRRHEQVSAFTISGKTLRKDTEKTKDFWHALPALGHHGTFTEPYQGERGLPGQIQEVMDQGWNQAQEDLLDILSETLQISPADFPQEASPTATILLSGLLILADRIASGKDWVAENQRLMKQGDLSLDQPSAWIQACSERALARVKNTVGIYQGWEDSTAAQKAILGDYAPRPLQTQALKTSDGIWNAMAPTGNGKTEAALLRHSLREERLIFLLPTQATTNALMRRVQKTYRDTSNVAALAHGLSSIEDFYSQPVTLFSDTCQGRDSGGLYPTEFVKSGASRLLAPVCVGTIDQALMASLPMKWTHLRLLALANSHVVIDEIHTLDHYQSELLVPLLNWLGLTKTRVTFLSATFPQWQRDRFLKAYTGQENESKAFFPAAEAISRDSSQPQQTKLEVPQYTIDFSFQEPASNDLVACHIKWAQEQRKKFPLARLGIICNTVQRAQKIAQQLSAQGEKLVLLHSRMTAEHRKQQAQLLEETIGAQGKGQGLTVVGTQAIEASLDIDLDLLSTDLCPAPSLIQRAGRVWRRADPERNQRISGVKNLSIQVVRPKDAEAWVLKPYFEAELARTWDFLQKSSTFSCPDFNQAFVDASSVTLESILSSADLDQFAENSQALKRGKEKSEHLGRALGPHSEIQDLKEMTKRDTKDTDDSAFTRLIENDIRQVIVAGDPQQIPGAWVGSMEDLLSLESSDQKRIRAALKASMPISVNKENRAYLDSLPSLEQSKTLLNRYFYMQVPAGSIYDPALGFVGGGKP